MLTLTREAAHAIRELTEPESADGVRIHAGTRRFSRADSPSIQIEVAPWPDVDDLVLEVAGARIYLDTETLKAIDDKVLDADLSGEEPHFTLLQQPDLARL